MHSVEERGGRRGRWRRKEGETKGEERREGGKGEGEGKTKE